MTYIEGFVVAVPAAEKDTYCRLATDAATMFKEFGATRIVEAWGDDVPDGVVTDFKGAVKAEEGEVVVVSWVEYPSKAVRDAANAKIRTDPRMQELGANMPFDGKRMIYGGFAIVLDEGETGAMGYVDTALVPVVVGDKQAFVDSARKYVDVLREYGATRVVDASGDDVPDGKVTDFKGAVKATSEEAVVYSWIEWPSKAVRDAGWEKVFVDPRMHEEPFPTDLQRWVQGGFVPILDAA